VIEMTDPDFINQKLSPVLESVDEFAQTHGFELGKCLRGNAGWKLTRAHHEGGSIYLLMMYHNDLGLGIGSSWQVSCQETGMLYSHFRSMHPCPIEPAAVTQSLADELAALSKVRFGHWTHLTPLDPESGDGVATKQ
jgi:hypothetical protein